MNWVPVPGWESFYEVSDAGFVRSIGRFVNARGGKKAFRKGRVLSFVEKENGYLCITLCHEKRRPQISIHRLVARAFLGECPLGLHVLHNDGNKKNNCVDNLRYGTAADNHADTERHGHRLKGDRHPMAKLSEDSVRAIRLSSLPTKQLAKAYSVNSAHILAIKSRRVWRHI